MEYTFDRHETFVVGRSSQVQFPVPEDGFLSRNHFLIEFNPPVCFLRDLGSTNGTKVNGTRVDAVRLRDGDAISAGESSFVVRVEETSWDGRPKIHCLGCGKLAPPDLAVSALPDEDAITWLCDDCVAHRRQYPTTDSEYLIEKRIGGGGMGEVYLARHLPDQPAGRHQDDGPLDRRQRPGQAPVPARAGRPQEPPPPQHRRLPHDVRARRPVPARHGIRRRQGRPRVGQVAARPALGLGRRPGSACN